MKKIGKVIEFLIVLMGLEASEWCWGSRNAAVVEWHLVS